MFFELAERTAVFYEVLCLGPSYLYKLSGIQGDCRVSLLLTRREIAETGLNAGVSRNSTSGERTMASKKRAALNPELPAARAAKRAAAAQSVLERDERARRAAKAKKAVSARTQPSKSKARSKRKQ